MKTLAEFKRDATSGKIALELYEYYGKTEIPENLLGVRSISKVNTVGVTLRNTRGEESYLDIGHASLIEYDGETLTVYSPGYRQPTAAEQATLDEWVKIAEEYQKKDPCGNSWHWKYEDYFEKSPCPWMCGSKEIRGKKYIHYSGEVRDRAIKGDAILKYRILHI